MSKSSEQNVVLLDGGIGHELKLRGISDGSFVAGVLANAKNGASQAGAEIVESIHYDFLRAGCDVVTSNSFVAVPQRMLECGLASDEDGANDRAASLIRASVDRARAAIVRHKEQDTSSKPRKRLIAGCVPPLTECYFAREVPASADELVPGYKVILSTLLDCSVDVLFAKTLSTSREAMAILRTLSSIQSNKRHIPPLWISFTVHDDRPMELRSDEIIEDACQSIIRESNSLGIPLQAIGVNCSAPSAISNAVPILAKAVQGTEIKVCAYGNCFQTTTSDWIRSLDEINIADADGPTLHDEKQMECAEDYDKDGYLLPIAYARYATEWRDAGATIIGGCCGCRPMHLSKVARALKSR